MKNFITASLLCLSLSLLSAQEGLKIGIQGGLPLGDFDRQVSLVLAADLGYMWALGEVVDLGPAVGFINGFTDNFNEDLGADLPNVQFLPLAASIRVWPSNNFSFGIDGGYAVGINSGNNGGLYGRPIIGYLLGAQSEINLSYTHVSLEDVNWGSVTLGLLFTIKVSGRSY